MPTPFMHLHAAHRFLSDESVSAAVRQFLSAHLGAFLLGNIAPDARVSGGLDRANTHFFDYGPKIEPHAVDAMLAAYPELKFAKEDRRAFIAGYIAHLAMDVVWAEGMLYMYFYKRKDWADGRTRFNMLHVLLCYLDARDYRQWPEEFSAALESAQPHDWIPVIPDNALAAWRNLIAYQICAECDSQTVPLLGGRVDIGEAGLRDILGNGQRMEDELWHYVPPGVVADIEGQMYDAMKTWVEKYMMETEK